MESNKLYKAKQIVSKYKAIISNKPFGVKEPIYFKNWIVRLLKIEYLIIDLKYK